jgi:putative ABC transport system substrate-binding protein
MQRRDFITLLGGVAAASATSRNARAQQSGRVRRLGVLAGGPEDDPEVQARMKAFQASLRQLGWIAGRNITIDYRFVVSGSPDRLQLVVNELLSLGPDLVVIQGTPATAAVLAEARTIPGVFLAVSDPTGSGFVASLARPGGNFTGLLFYEEGIIGKWLAMLKEIAPNLKRVAIIASRSPSFDYFLRSAKPLASSLAVEVTSAAFGNVGEIEAVMTALGPERDLGLVWPPAIAATGQRNLITALAARYRLPAVYSARYFVTAGGLMSYGIDLVDHWRQATYYVDRILRGDKPADLPVQAPTKYETVINLKTAKELGLTVPDLMLVRADEVIE